MTLILSGTDGVSDIDGTAATPAIRGTDANTGIFFPAADTIAFSEGGVESMRIDSSGNVGIGRTPVTYGSFRVLDVAGASGAIQKWIHTGSAVELQAYATSQITGIGSATNTPLTFTTNDTERMRIDSSGNVKLSTAGTSILNSSGNKILNQTGSVLQVVNFTDATYQSTTSTTFADTVLTLSITPSSASNKILVLITLNGIGKNTNTAGGGAGSYRLVNGSNSLIANIFDGAGWTGVSEYMPGLGASFIYLDSPNTTSSYTYKVQYATEQTGQGATLNWYNDNTVTRSTITLMEIAA